jgi:hypothetical protein
MEALVCTTCSRPAPRLHRPLPLAVGLGALFIVVAARPAPADRARCLLASGALATAKLDLAVRDAWNQCPCKWSAGVAATRASREFGRCVKRVAAEAVRVGHLARPCYTEVVRSARFSTCGWHEADAITCCQRDACTITKPPPGVTTPPMLCNGRGGRVGGSPSCYDACPSVDVRVCDGSEDVDAAYKRAEHTIATALRQPFDVTNPQHAGWLLLQGPHELGCFVAGAVTKDFGPPLTVNTGPPT